MRFRILSRRHAVTSTICDACQANGVRCAKLIVDWTSSQREMDICGPCARALLGAATPSAKRKTAR